MTVFKHVSNVLTHRLQFHQSRLVEDVIPSRVQYQDTLHRMTDYFVAQGSELVQAQQRAIQWIGQQVQAQASFLAYMDAFWVLMLISLALVPARADTAQGQAGRRRPHGTLTIETPIEPPVLRAALINAEAWSVLDGSIPS